MDKVWINSICKGKRMRNNIKNATPHTKPRPQRYAGGLLTLTLGLAVSAIGASAYAGDAAQLSTALTPLGGERAGNKDGSIPAWSPERQDAPAWKWGQPRLNHWKYRDDKPLFSVDASNVDKYASKLSPGQIALIKQTKGYRMDVYPTRRSCGVPDFVAENTQKNVGFAKLAANGWSLQDAYVPGIPFPMPSNGAEAMVNMSLRYRGVGVEYKNTATLLSPRKGAEDWVTVGYDQTMYLPWATKGSRKLSEVGYHRMYTYFALNSPTALAGQAGVISDYIDQPGTETFYYFPGQRRVRRLPSYGYDAPQIGFENQYAIDETQVFMGALDRFDWKLVGKKEMLVPYNAFGAYDFSGKRSDIVQRDFIEPGHRHYELHRVWVVEASVKAGARHMAPKRTFYLDEDSWNAVLAEDYDGQNKLSKVREGFLVPAYETGTCDVSAFVQYNLIEGRYLFDFNAVGGGTDTHWITEAGNNPLMKPSFYTADNLRASSER
jgi:hypothetical protein